MEYFSYLVGNNRTFPQTAKRADHAASLMDFHQADETVQVKLEACRCYHGQRWTQFGLRITVQEEGADDGPRYPTHVDRHLS